MKKINNKTLALATLFIILLGLFSFFETTIKKRQELEVFTFVTALPTESLLDTNGWWNEMPTPLSIENVPVSQTPQP